uniref:Uncharacterized protein n=1 Tax=Glossina palpalis gambiensis TaxID=67801 RepID=A0A1B0BZN8_9MUSC
MSSNYAGKEVPNECKESRKQPTIMKVMLAGNGKKGRHLVIMDSDDDLQNEENVNMNLENLHDTQNEVFHSSNINKLNLKLHEKTNILCLACKNMNVQAQVFDEPLVKDKSKPISS